MTPLIVALDYPQKAEALALVTLLDDSVQSYKVGMQLFYAEGIPLIKTLQSLKKNIFLDLKINDIPETVAKAVESLIRLDVQYLTLFTQATQIQRAREVVDKNKSPLKLLNVSVLTSEPSTLADVARRTEMSLQAGAHGVICSGQETAQLRQNHGAGFIIVNPGIRPADNQTTDDQVRVVTPRMALDAGATNIVVGRPITQAPNPREAALAILKEID